MKTFKIEITETLSKVITVESDSIETATKQVQQQYQKSEIVLDYTNLISTDFSSSTKKKTDKEKIDLTKELIDYLFDSEKKHFEEFLIKPNNHMYLKLKKLKEIVRGK